MGQQPPYFFFVGGGKGGGLEGGVVFCSFLSSNNEKKTISNVSLRLCYNQKFTTIPKDSTGLGRRGLD